MMSRIQDKIHETEEYQAVADATAESDESGSDRDRSTSSRNVGQSEVTADQAMDALKIILLFLIWRELAGGA